MSKETTQVWDIAIRFFHWSLVFFFLLTYITGEELETVHAYAGYVIIALLVFRVLYGFIGTKHARFSDFIYPPQEIISYLMSMFEGSPKRYLGHNPAGGAMVILLLVFLSLSSWSGLKAYEAEGKGLLVSAEISLVSLASVDGWYESDDEREHHSRGEKDEFWEEVHEVLVNFTLLLVFLHLVGVFISSVLHGENLPRTMITGRKTLDSNE